MPKQLYADDLACQMASAFHSDPRIRPALLAALQGGEDEVWSAASVLSLVPKLGKSMSETLLRTVTSSPSIVEPSRRFLLETLAYNDYSPALPLVRQGVDELRRGYANILTLFEYKHNKQIITSIKALAVCLSRPSFQDGRHEEIYQAINTLACMLK